MTLASITSRTTRHTNRHSKSNRRRRSLSRINPPIQILMQVKQVNIRRTTTINTRFLSNLLKNRQTTRSNLFTTDRNNSNNRTQRVLYSTRHSRSNTRRSNRKRRSTRHTTSRIRPRVTSHVKTTRRRTTRRNSKCNSTSHNKGRILRTRTYSLSKVTRHLIEQVKLPIHIHRRKYNHIRHRQDQRIIRTRQRQRPKLRTLRRMRSRRTRRKRTGRSTRVHLPKLSFQRVRTSSTVSPLFRRRVLVNHMRTVRMVTRQPMCNHRSRNSRARHRGDVRVCRFKALELFPNPRGHSKQRETAPVCAAPTVPGAAPVTRGATVVSSPPPSQSNQEQ